MTAYRRIALLAVPALLAAAAAPMLAQGGPPGPPGAADPARVTAGSYVTDPNHSLVGWKINHLGINDYFGIFGSVAGTLTLDPKSPNAAKVDVTIPVSKVTTASSGLTAHLLKAPAAAGGKPDFFGPTPADAHFVSTSVKATGSKAIIVGNLTLNGVTKPVTLNAEFAGAGKVAMMGNKEYVGFHAKGSLKRSDFGLGFIIPMVGDKVDLDITVAFEKKPA